MIEGKLCLRLIFLIALVLVINDVTHGMNIGQHEEVETGKRVVNRDQNTKNEDSETNEGRDLELIDDVLDHFFENEEEGSATGSDQQQSNEALKFFVTTRTKTLKTTVTSTQSLTSYQQDLEASQ